MRCPDIIEKRCLFTSLVLVAALLVACTSEVEPPKRGAAIPPEAVWVGGADGGAWILCREDGDQNSCTIYHDNTGEVWVRGNFVLQGSTRGVSTQELRYDFFDGERIGLLDGRVLTLTRAE